MSQRLRHVKPYVCMKALQVTVFVLGAMGASWAQALTLGHARVISAPGAPLQVVVPLLAESPEEATSLKVLLADEASWQRAGLQPPTPLASTVVRLEEGSTSTRRTLRIESPEAPATSVVDLLLEVASSSGQHQIQVSILMAPRRPVAAVTPPVVGKPTRRSSGEAVHVQKGDTLSAIAQRNAMGDATFYQMLVALWRANPHAFIQNNMNLLRAGETLTMPDIATVQAIDPVEARRIFNEQTEAYARYRSRVAAAAAAGSVLAGADASSGKLGAGGPPTETPAASGQDRLRVSRGQSKGADDSVAKADARTSTERAMNEARERVNELENNVRMLNEEVARQSQSVTPTPGPSRAAGAEPAAPDVQNGSLHGANTGAAPTEQPGDSPYPDMGLALSQVPDKDVESGLSAWRSSYLLIIVTVVVGLLAFAIAWLLRSMGARRHRSNGIFGRPVNPDLNTQLNERLDDIDLQLDSPSSDDLLYPPGGPKA
jgi:pilus assembly protein FimV